MAADKLTPSCHLPAGLVVLLALLALATSTQAADLPRSPEGMRTALETCPSATHLTNNCGGYDEAPFSLSLRDVYVPPKDWWQRIREPLTTARAMELVFGNYDVHRETSAHWVEGGSTSSGIFRPGWACAEAQLLFPVFEGRKASYWLVAVSGSEHVTGSCNACSVFVTMARFRETPGGWRIDAISRNAFRTGGKGTTDLMVPIRLGKDKIGVWAQGCGMVHGCIGGRANIWTFVGGRFREVFNVWVVEDSTNSFFPPGTRDTYRYRFERGADGGFDPILASIKRLTWREGKRIERVEHKRYEMRAGRYVPVDQAASSRNVQRTDATRR